MYNSLNTITVNSKLNHTLYETPCWEPFRVGSSQQGVFVYGVNSMYTIGTTTFPTKYSFKRWFASLYETPTTPHQTYTLDHTAQQQIQLALETYHHKFQDKLPIDKIKVTLNQNRQQHLTVYFQNGTSIVTGKSWIDSIDKSNAARHMDNIIEGMRNAVKQDVFIVKQEAFRKGYATCHISGRMLSERQCHMDHVYPNTFSSIVAQFMELLDKYQISIDSIPVYNPNDGLGYRLDAEFDAAFCRFHKKFLKHIKPCAKSINLSRGNRA